MKLDGNNWTEPRRRGLLAFSTEGSARISNCTSSGVNFVYWQIANWVVEKGYADQSGEFLQLTPRGWAIRRHFQGEWATSTRAR